jgi:hypothetical protein
LSLAAPTLILANFSGTSLNSDASELQRVVHRKDWKVRGFGWIFVGLGLDLAGISAKSISGPTSPFGDNRTDGPPRTARTILVSVEDAASTWMPSGRSSGPRVIRNV